MQAVFITAGSTYDGAVGRSVGLHETAGEDTLVGSTGNFKVYIGHAIAVVLAKVEHEAVDDNRTYRAVVTVRPAGVPVEQRGGELLVSRLELGDMLDDVTLAEIG